VFTALAFSFMAATFLFFLNENGMVWLMWRDTTWLAILLTLAALLCAVLAWKTPRDENPGP
jgi:hypothetical protein